MGILKNRGFPVRRFVLFRRVERARIQREHETDFGFRDGRVRVRRPRGVLVQHEIPDVRRMQKSRRSVTRSDSGGHDGSPRKRYFGRANGITREF